MKINALLTERTIIQEQILTDSTYREFYTLGNRLLTEFAMNQADIQKLFKTVADGAAAGGNVDKEGDAPASNRTLLGKGADAAKAVNQAYQGVKQWIGKTGPVKGLDAMIDSVQRQITQASGGEGGQLSQTIEWYRELSKIPGMAMAVKAIIMATAGLLGSGLGPVGVAAGLTFANKMLQGDKFSSAVMNAAETGGMVMGIQKAKELLGGAGFDAGQGNDWGGEQTGGFDAGQGNDWGGEQQFQPTDSMGFAGRGQVNPDFVNPDAGATDTGTDTTQPVTGGGDNTGGTSPANAVAQEYTVTAADGKEGLGGIAKKYPGISTQDIMDYNGLNTTVIKPGQVIQIPAPDVVSPSADNKNIWQGWQGAPEQASQNANTNWDAEEAAEKAKWAGKPDDMGWVNDKPNAPQNNPFGNMGQPAGTTPEGNPITVKQAPALAPSDNTIDPRTGYVRGNPWGKPGTRSITSSYQNPNKMIGESAGLYFIDRETTARRWVLNEQLGRPRGGVYITKEGVEALFKEVARRSQVNEGPALDKLKSFNKRAGAAINKFTTPIKQTLRRGAESMTNKITFRDLMLNWQRSAKMAGEESVDSDQVLKFLKDQGVKDPLIKASMAQLGYQGQEVTSSPGVQSDGGNMGAGFLQAFGADKAAQAWKDANKSKGLKSNKYMAFAKQPQQEPEQQPQPQDVAQTKGKEKGKGKGKNKNRGININFNNSSNATNTQTAPQATPAAQPAQQPARQTEPVTAKAANNVMSPVNANAAHRGPGNTYNINQPATTATANAQGWNDPKSANYVGRREVARRQAQAVPNYGQQMPAAGKVTYNAPTGVNMNQFKPQGAPQGTTYDTRTKHPVATVPVPDQTMKQKQMAGKINRGTPVMETDFSALLLRKIK